MTGSGGPLGVPTILSGWRRQGLVIFCETSDGAPGRTRSGRRTTPLFDKISVHRVSAGKELATSFSLLYQ